MSLFADSDLELRYALFDHVARLRDAGGGVVTGDALDQGLVFEGQRIPIWSRARGIFRPAVLGKAGAALTVQTSFRSPYDDQVDPESDRFAYRYQGTDPLQYDNVALRRAMELGRPILYLVAVRPGIYQPIFPTWVVGDDPASLTFFFIADAEGAIAPPVSGEADPSWPLKAYVTREVKVRLHQRRFRYLVLDAYRESCAMCRLRHARLLDAAHILPDRDVRGNPEVPNGLALCKIHHSAFDEGILGVDPDYRIHLRTDVLEERDGPMLEHGLQKMHDQLIRVPRRAEDRPNRDYLAERFDRFRAA